MAANEDPPPPPPPGSSDEAGRAKHVNLYFGTKAELADVSRKDDASTAYIIFQNDRLHSQADRLQKRLRDAERERDRSADDADRSERSRTCLRGMLHNEVERSSVLREMLGLAESAAAARAADGARVAGAAAVHAAFGLALHALGWWLAGASPCGAWPRLALSVHVGNAAVFGWTVYGRSAARRGEDGPEMRELRRRLAEAERGTSHLHEIVDEM